MDGAPTIRHLELGLTAPGHGAAPALEAPQLAGRAQALPRAGWPAKHDLDYLKTVIELLVLLLGIPWLLKRLATNPKATSRRAASKNLA